MEGQDGPGVAGTGGKVTWMWLGRLKWRRREMGRGCALAAGEGQRVPMEEVEALLLPEREQQRGRV